MRLLSVIVAFVAGLAVYPCWDAYHAWSRYKATGQFFYE